MRRRQILGLLAGTATSWPLVVLGQSVPTLGFLNAASPNGNLARALAAFFRGLAEAGYEDGRNVAIEYRWAEGRYDRLAALAADLVGRKVDVIVATGTLAAVEAKAATRATPIVFTTSGDPVELGLVTSLNQPGGNLTGATQLSVEAAPKRLELLHDLLPKAIDIGLLLNPQAANSKIVSQELQVASSALGLRLHVLAATNESELAQIFASLPQRRVEALVVVTDAFLNNNSAAIAALALTHRLPAIYQYKEFTDAGGLMSFGGELTDSYRIAGAYAGRILKGEKPADLAVQRVTKVELIFNLKTAKMLGLTVPPSILARADEVIE
jgi:putative ABC transport system substrate-binding protein